MASNGWIAVDLDGTLAQYNGWVSEEHIGNPVPAMLTRVKEWLAAGRDVRIFTARVDGGEVAIAMGNEDGQRFRDVQRVKGFIERWCLEHIGQVLPITNRKDYGMIELWDDRCVQVVPNTGEAFADRIAALEQDNAQLRAENTKLKQPVSDEEQDRFMKSAQETIAKEYGCPWSDLPLRTVESPMTATDVLMDLVRTEASLQALAARSQTGGGTNVTSDTKGKEA
jgi:hypothetical protein